MLYRPESSKEQTTPLPTTGFVILLGQELIKFKKRSETDTVATIIDCPLREGDAVMFGKYAGTTCNIENVEYRILFMDDIMCTLEATNPEAYAVTTD